ncbi:nicotinic acid mononucleotide adenylyltransferase [Lottiidibacillus patelloidae]|uniref:Probable nicotinate-nucleotide adenylyltransferase n=1 Tax=Lottiidibacillus patelloidae TaxID=2670334 RepID=A0A263BVJ6_9BACI|nr:nicotinate-nucleotide adenylyltransferase [Lottiidibacillus patelloidae]OZM57771.1 nicotinic acid mononucleotide adenylyltransferase [Lottiidibacillus patelloidae]
MAKIGILGGTFNPPHIGHLIIAEDVLKKQNLDEVWFMPNSHPPHKTTETSAHDRLKMVQLAIYNHPSFKVCTVELELDGPSFTAKTMKTLRAKYSQHEFYFIIGADSVETLSSWYEIDELLKLVTFIAVKRSGFVINSPYNKHIIQVDTPIVDISSTELRKRIKNEENYTYLTVEAVRHYIKEHRLYGKK